MNLDHLLHPNSCSSQCIICTKLRDNEIELSILNNKITRRRNKMNDTKRVQAIKIVINEVMVQVLHPENSSKSSNTKIEKALKTLGFLDAEIKDIQNWWG